MTDVLFPAETLKEEFVKVREQYFNDLGVTCKIVNLPIVPHIKDVDAFFPHEGWQRLAHFSSTAKHEIGHPTIAPGDRVQHYRYYGIAAKVFKANSSSKEHYGHLCEMLNYVYDMMVNYWIHHHAEVDTKEWVEDTLHDLPEVMFRVQKVQWKILVAFHQELCGGSLFPTVKFSPEIEDAGTKALLAVEHCFNKDAVTEDDKAHCVKELCEIIRDTLEKEMGDVDDDDVGDENVAGESDDMKRLEKDNEKGGEDGDGDGNTKGERPGLGGGHPVSGMPDKSGDAIGEARTNGWIDGEQEAMLRSDDNYYEGYTKGGNAARESIEAYRREARKKLVIEGLKTETVATRGLMAQRGTSVRGGLWLEGMKDAECNYVATLENHGIIIPEENVVRDRPKMKGKQEKVQMDVHLIADTSASMSKREICIALFSFLEYAAKLDGTMSVTLFADYDYYRDSSKSASKLENDIYTNWHTGGTDIVSGIAETEKAINKMNSHKAQHQLVAMVSDFQDENKARSQCRVLLESCAKKGATVIAVAMGDFAKPLRPKGVIEVLSPNLSELATNLLRASKAFIK